MADFTVKILKGHALNHIGSLEARDRMRKDANIVPVPDATPVRFTANTPGAQALMGMNVIKVRTITRAKQFVAQNSSFTFDGDSLS